MKPTTNQATKKELEHATGVDAFKLAAKTDSIALKAEVKKLNTNKLVNVPTTLNNLKTRVDDLHNDKLKAVPVNFKKLSGVGDKQVVKNKKLNTLKTKVNKIDKEIPDATTLIYINQYDTDKQSLKKKLEMLIKKYLTLVVY